MDATREELAKLLAQQVDWSRYNQPFGELSDPNPVAYKTPYGNIYQGDVNRAQDLGMAFSGGGLGIKPVGGMTDILTAGDVRPAGAANDVSTMVPRAPTYQAAVKNQQIARIAGEDAHVGDFNYWRDIATKEGHTLEYLPNKPNAYAAARAYSRDGKTTMLLDSRGRRTVYRDGEKVVRESRKDLPPADE